VLPLPINQVETEQAEPLALTTPIRIGLVGMASEAKGITPFLGLAATFRRTLPDAVTFHLVGNPLTGTDMTPYAALHEPPRMERFERADFVEKLKRLHYVCLPLNPAYYTFSASGALLDAVTWLKPVIATRVPFIADLFDRFGDIGELCDDVDSMRDAIEGLAVNPDPERYARQVANLRRVQASRTPAALAADYRMMTNAVFPGLLAPRSHG
jgi:glycosyltransferase involved in cell wall biosynthesis